MGGDGWYDHLADAEATISISYHDTLIKLDCGNVTLTEPE